MLAKQSFSLASASADHFFIDQRLWQRAPVLANIQQLRTAIEEEWDIIPQATINSLIWTMRRDVSRSMRQMVVCDKQKQLMNVAVAGLLLTFFSEYL